MGYIRLLTQEEFDRFFEDSSTNDQEFQRLDEDSTKQREEHPAEEYVPTVQQQKVEVPPYSATPKEVLDTRGPRRLSWEEYKRRTQRPKPPPLPRNGQTLDPTKPRTRGGRKFKARQRRKELYYFINITRGETKKRYRQELRILNRDGLVFSGRGSTGGSQ